MIKLESCPFCGGEAMVFVSESVCVMCKKCHCQTLPTADGCIAEAEKHNALESVIKAWNRRPDPVAPYEYEGTWYCGNCSDPVNKNDKFCHECGKLVKWE
jgi:hypothetical protein